MSINSIKFIDESHRYVNSEGVDLISVSAFMKKFEPKKNWDAIAAKTAKKQGVTKQSLLDLWEMKRNKGTEAGTLFHSKKEKDIITQGEFKFNGVTLERRVCEVKEGCKHSFPITEIKNGFVYPELMIYDHDYMICGQSDKVIVQDGFINIFDFKTDKSIDFKAYSSEWVKPEKLLPPLSHLDNCNGNAYTIKMSLYMYMLWKANKGKFKPGKIILEWCPLERDTEGIPILYDGMPRTTKEEQIELTYRKREVEAMLKTIKP